MSEPVFLYMSGPGWEGSSTVMLDTHVHFQVVIAGQTRQAVLTGLEAVETVLAAGRKTFWRGEPTVESEKDFAHDKIVHQGYMRLSFANEPGERVLPAVREDGCILGLKP